MKRITYKDLQLDIETKLEAKIYSILEDNNLNNKSEKLDFEKEKYFFELLRYAIEIEGHYSVDSLKRIFTDLMIERKVEIKIFLYQADKFNINCFKRNDDLLIFVSQHFFNNLVEDEQLAIIGHEVAHLLFDHHKFPSKNLINFPFELGNIGHLKQYLIYYSKVKEITADILGLVACDYNYKAYSSALIKHSTGLSDSNNSSFSISPLIDIVLRQYEKHLQNPYFFDLHSTHPLMPVRVKIINSIAKSRLIRNYNEEVSDENFEIYKKEYNEIINEIIRSAYPEIFPNNSQIDKVLIPMSFAVMLADGKIDENEISHIKKSIDESKLDFSDMVEKYSLANIGNDFNGARKELIKDSVHLAKGNNFDKHLIIPIIRELIIVAASDGNIDKSELKTIFQFSKNFGFTKDDIVLIIKTQYEV